MADSILIYRKKEFHFHNWYTKVNAYAKFENNWNKAVKSDKTYKNPELLTYKDVSTSC